MNCEHNFESVTYIMGHPVYYFNLILNMTLHLECYKYSRNMCLNLYCKHGKNKIDLTKTPILAV